MATSTDVTGHRTTSFRDRPLAVTRIAAKKAQQPDCSLYAIVSRATSQPISTNGPHLLTLAQEIIDEIIGHIIVPGVSASSLRGLFLASKGLSAQAFATISRQNKWAYIICGATSDGLMRRHIRKWAGPTASEVTSLALGSLPQNFREVDSAWYLVLMFTCLVLQHFHHREWKVEKFQEQQYQVALRWKREWSTVDGQKRKAVAEVYDLLTKRLKRAEIWVGDFTWSHLPGEERTSVSSMMQSYRWNLSQRHIRMRKERVKAPSEFSEHRYLLKEDGLDDMAISGHLAPKVEEEEALRQSVIRRRIRHRDV